MAPKKPTIFNNVAPGRKPRLKVAGDANVVPLVAGPIIAAPPTTPGVNSVITKVPLSPALDAMQNTSPTSNISTVTACR